MLKTNTSYMITKAKIHSKIIDYIFTPILQSEQTVSNLLLMFCVVQALIQDG